MSEKMYKRPLKQYEKDRISDNINKTWTQLMKEDSDYYYKVHWYKDVELNKIIYYDYSYYLKLNNYLK